MRTKVGRLTRAILYVSKAGLEKLLRNNPARKSSQGNPKENGVYFPKSFRNLDYDVIIHPSRNIVNDETAKTAIRNAKYKLAVEQGDVATEERLLSEAAKEWGAVTNDRGKPIRLYRGTRNFGRTPSPLCHSGRGGLF